MARATLVDGSVSTTINFDDPRPQGTLFQGIVVAQLWDEITDQPVGTAVSVTTTMFGAQPAVSTDGVAGIAGVPTKVLPRLNVPPDYTYDLEFSAQGFISQEATGPIPTQPSFPATFTETNLGQIVLRRNPLTLSGRAVTVGGSGQAVPCPGATVVITGLWRQLSQVLSTVTPPATLALYVSPSAYGSRAAGAGLEIVAPTLVAGDSATLETDLGASSATFTITPFPGLATGAVLCFDAGTPSITEYFVASQVTFGPLAGSPATVVLAFPAQFRHRIGAPIQVATFPAPGAPDAVLTDAVAAGDPTVFVDTIAPFAPAQVVRISDGVSPDEYVVCGAYSVVSDGSGFYSFPPLSRIAGMQVTATKGALATNTAPNKSPLFTPDYSLSANRLDLTLF